MALPDTARADATIGTAGYTDAMDPVPHRVVGLRPEVNGVVSLTLDPVAHSLAQVQPGQFVMAWVFGVGEIPISVSRAGAAGRLLLTVRAVGAVSAALCTLHVGAVVGLRGPYGTGWPCARAAGRDVVVVGGGLGLAPLRMAIDTIAEGLAPTAPNGPRSLTVVVGARSPDQVLYPDDLERWRSAGAQVHVTVDVADRNWHDAVGTTTAVLQRLAMPFALALVCGPELMMTSGARTLVAHDVPATDVWVSMERNMHCGVGQCGRCQLGPLLLCRDGAVVPWSQVADLVEVRGR